MRRVVLASLAISLSSGLVACEESDDSDGGTTPDAAIGPDLGEQEDGGATSDMGPSDMGRPSDMGSLDEGVDDPCSTTTTLTPGATYPEGRFELFELEHDGRTRTFKVHVPAGYTGETPVPLLFGNHGLSQGAIMFGLDGSALEAKSDEAGFIAVFPNGVSNSWNAGSCCGGAVSNDVDDVGFFRAMVDYVRDDLGLCVDRTRIYSTGYSNGGFISYRLACEASDLFAAIAPVAGSLVLPAEACEATRTRPVPLLHIHGDDDGIVDYGSSIDDEGGFSAVRSVAQWAAMNGCDDPPAPATQPSSMLDTTCVSYSGCDDGAEVTFCTVAGGGHCWFGHSTCGTGVDGVGFIVGDNAEGIVSTDAVWGFLSRFDCPTCGL